MRRGGDHARAQDGVYFCDDLRLAYLRFGKDNAHPAFFFHGTPGSRLEARALEIGADRIGLDLIAFDRPEIGLSKPQPGWTLRSLAKDILRFADALEWDRFSLIAYSGGAPSMYALATAAGDRVYGVVDIAGWAPTHSNPEFRKLISPADRVFGVMARIWPGAVRLGFHPLAMAAYRRDFDRIRMLLASSLGAPDRALLGMENFADFLIEDLREAFRQRKRGAARDTVNALRAWDCDIADLACPVTLVHGDDDKFVPIEFSRWKKDRLPLAHLRTLHGHGHFAALFKAGEQLAELMPWLEHVAPQSSWRRK